MEVLKWIVANWSTILEAAGLLVGSASVIVAKLPQSASRNRAVAVLERVSVLTHRDSPGTLKMLGATAVVAAPGLAEPPASER